MIRITKSQTERRKQSFIVVTKVGYTITSPLFPFFSYSLSYQSIA
jgi:hypothetical protein